MNPLRSSGYCIFQPGLTVCLECVYVVPSKWSRNHVICEKYKRVQTFKLRFLQSIPLCNYTLLPVTVKVLETFLESILWKPFQLFRRILSGVSSTTKLPSLRCWFQSREQVKISWSQIRRVWGVFQCCNFTCWETDRCAGALSWRRNQLLVLDFSGSFLETTSPRRRISLFTVATPVNRVSDFL